MVYFKEEGPVKMDINEKLRNLPEDPGVYIMYDSDGSILYVGKAKNLKNRVRQYFFHSAGKTLKVDIMVSRIADFRYIVTASETDALSLENNLIKKYKPPYNILLKDDKQYPYIKIDVKDSFPRVTMTRKLVKDGSRYFGPIIGVSVRDVFKILEAFPTRTCSLDLSKLPANFRPCLNADIGRCSAPCKGRISEADYREIIAGITEFLSGSDAKARKVITEKMLEASEKENYEKALEYKQQLHVLDKLNEQRLVNTSPDLDADVFAIYGNGKSTAVGQLTIRSGRLLGGDAYITEDASLDEEQNLSGFLTQFYSSTNLDTKNIILNIPLSDAEILADYFSEKTGRKVTVSSPQRGLKRKLALMAQNNAAIFLDKNQTKVERDFNSTTGAMLHLMKALSLESMPRRIECYDISNISGTDKVASMVVFTNGTKDTKSYRRFRIKTVEGANDFACMKEVIFRRLTRIKNGDLDFGAKPDLIVVDGGKGQLSYAVKAMEEAGVKIPFASLAKKEELVFLPDRNEPVVMSKDSFGLKLLINLRDEAHRFAITYFRGLHGKNLLQSELDSIEGIGKKRQLILIRKFKSVANISKASLEELTDTEGLPQSAALAVYKHFHD